MKNNKNFLNFLAYTTLIIVAFLLIARWLAPIISLGYVLTNILESLQNVLVLIVVGISAFNYSNNSDKKWIKILFWIAVAIFIAGTVLLWI